MHHLYIILIHRHVLQFINATTTMKKTLLSVFIIIFALPLSPLTAQTKSHYHNVGDTIDGRSPIYFYNWWSDTWLADTSHRIAYAMDYFAVHGETCQYFYTDTALQIIGIASSCIVNRRYGYSLLIEDETTDTLPKPEYLRIYDATTDDFPLVAEVMFDRDIPKRYMNLVTKTHHDLSPSDNNCCFWETPLRTKTIAIREHYFDKPITVYDSFYVGYTIESRPAPLFDPHRDYSNNIGIGIMPYIYAWDSINYRHHFSGLCGSMCNSTHFLRKSRKLSWYNSPYYPSYGDTIPESKKWVWEDNAMFPIILPIIVIDSSYIIQPYECPTVQNFRVGSLGSANAVLLWDTHADHNSWQVSYGPAGTEPDSGSLINCPIQVCNITGLDTCTDYVAYIRALCYRDSTVFSEWNGPIPFSICDTSHTEPIGFSVGLDNYVKLFPNPASQSVIVFSSFEMYSVEFVDIKGRRIAHSNCHGHSIAFDVADWQPGTYFAIVRTSVGNFTKKLAVK